MTAQPIVQRTDCSSRPASGFSKTKTRLGSLLSVSALLLFGAQQQASAVTYTWTGNGVSTPWSTTTSWSGGVIPVSDLDTVIVFNNTTQNTTSTNDLGVVQLNRLTASNSGTKNMTIAGTVSNQLNFVKNSANVLPTLVIAKNSSGSFTVSSPLTVTDALTITNAGTDAGTTTFSGVIANAAGITTDGTGVGIFRFQSVISGAGGFTHSGSYAATLVAANTYTGATTVAAGTLTLTAANRISDSSNLVMAGGTFSTGGFNETLGTLSLSANSIIDLGAGTSALVFADSSAATWGSSIGLSFVNFDSGTDSIRFGTNGSGLSGTQLGQVTINGVAATIDGNGFLVVSAVPEPSTYAAIVGALVLAGAIWKRRRAV